MADAALIASLVPLAQDLGKFADALSDAVPWMKTLLRDDRESFTVEAARTLRDCTATRDYAPFAHLTDDWRNTAEVWSDPGLAAALPGEVASRLGATVEGRVPRFRHVGDFRDRWGEGLAGGG